MNFETDDDFDLEYTEEDAEERLSQRDALLLGVARGSDGTSYAASRWAEGDS